MDTNAISLQTPVSAPEPPKPKNADEAATQFEALLLTQMLRAARSEEDQEDSTMDTMWDMAAQQFAQVMADSGGLGLARMIGDNLKVSDEEGTPKDGPKDVAKRIGNEPSAAGDSSPIASPFPTGLTN